MHSQSTELLSPHPRLSSRTLCTKFCEARLPRVPMLCEVKASLPTDSIPGMASSFMLPGPCSSNRCPQRVLVVLSTPPLTACLLQPPLLFSRHMLDALPSWVRGSLVSIDSPLSPPPSLLAQAFGPQATWERRRDIPLDLDHQETGGDGMTFG